MISASPEINLPEAERETLAAWQKHDTFRKSNEIRKASGKEFTFYDGPPFANGLPHYGHILANTLKDTVPRYWNMRGFYVERRFGWDCHGLPVEFEIEKRDKLKGRADILKMGVAKFNEECRQSVLHYAKEWQHTITRLGRWVDWDNQYRTMDTSFMESVWWVFSELHRRGLVYRDYKVVPYSPRITAVLSNFEANQNYKDVQDPAVTVKFKLRDEDASILAWTTTPWTLISNLALCVGSEINYVKIRDQQSGDVLYLAEARLEQIYKIKPGQEKPYEVLQTLPGEALKGKRYQPLFSYFADHPAAFRILVDDYVTVDDGTGVVHMAPAYGEDDFRVCRAAGIVLVDPLDEEGKFKAEVPEHAGVFVKDADKDIIRRLKEQGQLFRQDVLVHSYPFCERTDTPLIYRAIPAWYVAVEKIKDNLVANNQTINWVPGHLRDGRMGKWLENARDWAISRNRFWGTPIPMWICENNDQHLQAIGSIEQLQKLTGKKISDLHKHFIDDLTFKCSQCDGAMRRIAEVFDCWFESGSMPYAQIHYPFEHEAKFKRNFPADFIAEGLDQTRGWFYTLSVLSAALFGKPAFKNVIVNGIILDESGRKMSKRHRNYTAPDELLDKYGADSVRLYMLNSAILRGEDLIFADRGVKDTTRAVILPLWNAYSFLSTYAAADGWSPNKDLLLGKAPQVDHEMDRWIISRLQSLKTNVHEMMEKYLLYAVVPQVLSFIEDLTNWYIRLSRRRFWGADADDDSELSVASTNTKAALSPETERAYETLYFVMTEFTKIFAPFAPFIAEKIYQGLADGLAGAPESVHLCDMPMPQASLRDADLEARMALVRTVTELGRSLRAKHQIKTRQALASMLIITRSPDDRRYIENSLKMIKEELNVKDVQFTNEETKYVQLIVKPNLKTLGKRLGKELNNFRIHLEKLSSDQKQLTALFGDLDSKGQVIINDQTFSADDFLIERKPLDERPLATQAGVTILLDTRLTDELILEGLAREVINRVQRLRKDSQLVVSDRIQLHIYADGKVKEAILRHAPYIGRETLAVDVQVVDKAELNRLNHKAQTDIDGISCELALSVRN